MIIDLRFSELMQFRDNLIDIIGEGQQQIPVHTRLHHPLQKGIDGHVMRPEVLANKDHWTRVSKGEIMILHGILEHLLHGACTPRRVDDAPIRQCEDIVFADTVLEELGNMGGKWCGRLMTVEPGGNTEAYILILRILSHDMESRG